MEPSASRDDPTWRLACQIGFCARFDRPELEVETMRYFHDDHTMGDVFVDEPPTAVPARLIRDAGFFLVPASRTWDRVVSFGPSFSGASSHRRADSRRNWCSASVIG